VGSRLAALPDPVHEHRVGRRRGLGQRRRLQRFWNENYFSPM
jgi:hypothetical protein